VIACPSGPLRNTPPSGPRLPRAQSLVMSSFLRFLSSSVGTKILVALTGLGFTAFLVEHLVANLMVLSDAHGYNAYAPRLLPHPLIYVAEAGLVLLFVVHAFKAVAVTLRNRAARGSGYEMKARAGRNSRKTLASTTMIFPGLCVLLFIVIPLGTFKFGPYYETPDGMRDLSRLVHEVYREPFHVAF